MVMVPIREDEVFEGEEVFTARLSVGPDSNGVVIGRQGTATTSIIDGTITDSVICTMGLGPLQERNSQRYTTVRPLKKDPLHKGYLSIKGTRFCPILPPKKMTHLMTPRCPLFRGFTVIYLRVIPFIIC